LKAPTLVMQQSQATETSTHSWLSGSNSMGRHARCAVDI